MVKIDNKIPDPDNDSNKDNVDSNKDNTNEEQQQPTKTTRYEVDPKELTFGLDGIKNAKIVDGNVPNATTEPKKLTPEQIKAKELERLPYEDKNIKFIHLPDDPAYQPISLELIKMNEFEDEDLKLNTRIMMNIALSDYAIFRLIGDNGDIIDNTKVYFKRVKTNEFQNYVDLQTELDDLVRRVNILDATRPITLELMDKLYEYQKKLINVARRRVQNGFKIFFKWDKQDDKEIQDLFDSFDNNDITFNVDCAFLRITKSPFLRRRSSPSS